MPDSTRTALRLWHGADRFGCTAASGAFKSERDPAGAGSGFGRLCAVSAFVASVCVFVRKAETAIRKNEPYIR